MRFIVRIHRYLALAVSVQVLFWVVSGFYFTLFPIEEIRGNHLASSSVSTVDVNNPGIRPVGELIDENTHIRSATLRTLLADPVYEIETSSGRSLLHAISGETLSPIDEDVAGQLAEIYWKGDGTLESLSLLETPTRESGADGPVWKADFVGGQSASLYIRADTGEFRAVRTTKWRLFDVLWGLHIMDWWNRETISSWWMKLFAGVTIFMTLAGFVILGNQMSKGLFFR